MCLCVCECFLMWCVIICVSSVYCDGFVCSRKWAWLRALKAVLTGSSAAFTITLLSWALHFLGKFRNTSDHFYTSASPWKKTGHNAGTTFPMSPLVCAKLLLVQISQMWGFVLLFCVIYVSKSNLGSKMLVRQLKQFEDDALGTWKFVIGIFYYCVGQTINQQINR